MKERDKQLMRMELEAIKKAIDTYFDRQELRVASQ